MEAEVTAIAGTLITLDAASSEQYAGGEFSWTRTDGQVEYRTIVQTPDGDYRLSGTPVGLEVGMTVSVVLNCDHSPGANGCGLFGNILNYGGALWIPLKNPTTMSPFK